MAWWLAEGRQGSLPNGGPSILGSDRHVCSLSQPGDRLCLHNA